VTSSSLASLPSAAARPIQSERPEGEDATYDDAFLAVKARIDALGTLGGGINHERVLSGDADSVFDPSDPNEDFPFIVDTGTDLLLHRTKDLRIGCYVTLALFHTEGRRGLLCGLEVLHALVSTFRDALYPRRLRARNAALAFLATRLGEALDLTRTADLASSSRETMKEFQACLDVLQKLQDALSEHIDAYASGLAPLERRLSDARQATSRALSPAEDRLETEEHTDRPSPSSTDETSPDLDPSEPDPLKPEPLKPEPLKPEASQPEASPADISQPGASSTAAAGIPAQPRAHRDEDASEPVGASRAARSMARDAGEAHASDEPIPWSAIIQMVGRLRTADRTDPRPYDILRCIRWSRVKTAPAHRDGVTQIEPPPRRRRESLCLMMQAAVAPSSVDPAIDVNPAIDTAIDSAEDAFQEPPFHFWLSLQHDLLRVMERAGEAFTPARESIRRSLRTWVDRVPPIIDLSFADGTPFADSDTRQWLRTLAPTCAPEETKSTYDDPLDPDVSSAFLPRLVSHVRRVLHTDGLPEALDALEAENRARGERGLLLLRLMKGRLCLEAGRPSLARAVLEAIDRRLQASPTMMTYDLGLTLEVWSTLHRCYNQLRSDLLRQDPNDASGLADLAARIETVHNHIAAHAPKQALHKHPR